METRHMENNQLFPCEKCSDRFHRKDNLRKQKSLFNEMSDADLQFCLKILFFYLNKLQVKFSFKFQLFMTHDTELCRHHCEF